MYGSETTTLIISNEELNNIIKLKFLEDNKILNKGITNKVKNEVKQQKRWFLGVLAGTLGASLLSNLLLGQGLFRAGNQGKGMCRAGNHRKG